MTLASHRGNYVASGIFVLAPVGMGQYARVRVRPARAAGLVCRATRPYVRFSLSPFTLWGGDLRGFARRAGRGAQTRAAGRSLNSGDLGPRPASGPCLRHEACPRANQSNPPRVKCPLAAAKIATFCRHCLGTISCVAPSTNHMS